MKASLAQREPQRLQQWQDMGLYEKIRKESAGRPQFILHDGPPYANGELHLGHAVCAEALLVFLEEGLELLKLHLEDLDVVRVFVALLLQLIDLGRQLPLVLLAVFHRAEGAHRSL